MPIKIIQTTWIYDQFWQHLMRIIMAVSSTLLIYNLGRAIGTDLSAEAPSCADKLITLIQIVDFYKDCIYTICFPHMGPTITFWLWFSLFAPTTVLYTITDNLRASFLLLFGL